MLGVSPSSTPQERKGKATYDRYEVRLQAVQVQGVWRCRRVLRRTRGGSGRRGLGAAPQQWVPVSPVWAPPGQDRTGHGAPPLARRPHLRPYRLVVPPLELGVRGVCGRRRISTTRRSRQGRVASDLVNRVFSASGPNQVWVSDLERHEALLHRVVVKGHRLQSVAAG